MKDVALLEQSSRFIIFSLVLSVALALSVVSRENRSGQSCSSLALALQTSYLSAHPLRWCFALFFNYEYVFHF